MNEMFASEFTDVISHKIMFKLQRIEPFVVAFAGKYHFGAIKVNDMFEGEKVYYDEEALEEINKALEKKRYYTHTLVDKFSKFANTDAPEELFFSVDAPSFLVAATMRYLNDVNAPNKIKRLAPNTRKVLVNPYLKRVGFNSIMPAEEAANEMENFICNVFNVREKEITEPSDTIKTELHGYDKWSFRNPDPPKRKQKVK
jgi:hypothetical protein